MILVVRTHISVFKHLTAYLSRSLPLSVWASFVRINRRLLHMNQSSRPPLLKSIDVVAAFFVFHNRWCHFLLYLQQSIVSNSLSSSLVRLDQEEIKFAYACFAFVDFCLLLLKHNLLHSAYSSASPSFSFVVGLTKHEQRTTEIVRNHFFRFLILCFLKFFTGF